MSRPYNFTDKVKNEARLRQSGCCATCQLSLDDMYEHAHHVVPNQSGNPSNPDHTWLKYADNCVVLCVQCHERVHENGNYTTGAVAPASYYRYSHGENRVAHLEWIQFLNNKSRELWRP